MTIVVIWRYINKFEFELNLIESKPNHVIFKENPNQPQLTANYRSKKLLDNIGSGLN